MRKNYVSLAMVSGVSVASVLALAGCQNMDAGNIGGVVQGVSMAAKATTLNDDELMEMANQSCAAMDAENKVAPPNSSYAKRLQKVTANMPGQIGKQKAVYKVYMTSSVNAWAMDNGCIRVYSGLMDLMNDDELRGEADPRKDKPKAEKPKAEAPAPAPAAPKSSSPFAGLLGRLTGKTGKSNES